MSLSYSLNTTTLGGKPTWDVKDIAGLNRFAMRTGGGCGKGVFCMMRKDYEALVPQGGVSLAGSSGSGSSISLLKSTATLSMTGAPGPGLKLDVILGGAEPLIQSSTSDNSIDFMRVVVYDKRVGNIAPIKKAFNVLKDGLPFSGATPTCYSSTLNGASLWTWQQILNRCAVMSDAQQPINLPSWVPQNIIFDNVSQSDLIDDIAAQLFYIVGYDHQFVSAGTFGNVGTPTATRFFQPYPIPPLIALGGDPPIAAYGFQENQDLLLKVNTIGALINGAIPGEDGSAERNYARLPAVIDVVFPGVGDSDPYSSHRYYTRQVNTKFGSSDYTVTLNCGNYIASWNGSAWANQTALNAVGDDLGARCAAFMAQNYGQAELAGIWAFKPDGVYRQIEWISDEDGARTIISGGNTKDWLPYESLSDPINLPSRQEVVGLGSGIASVGQNGTKYVNLSGLPSGTGQYKVLQLIDAGNPGVWGIDYPRFHV